MRVTLITFLSIALAACSTDGGDSGGGTIAFPTEGPVAGEQGRGSFTFGAATASAQIEESVPELDWHLWTAPPPDGLGMGEDFVGDAVRGYELALDDVNLAVETQLDATPSAADRASPIQRALVTRAPPSPPRAWTR